MNYTDTDLIVIHHPHFQVLQLDDSACELLSVETKDQWKIIEKSGYLELWHKHPEEEEYHYQTAWLEMEDVFLDIADHDEYQAAGRDAERMKRFLEKHKDSSFYEFVLKIYQVAENK